MVEQGKFLIVLVCGAIIVNAVYRLADVIENLILFRGKENRVKDPVTRVVIGFGIEAIYQIILLITWAAFCPFWALYSRVTSVQSTAVTWFYTVAFFLMGIVGCWAARMSNIYARKRSDIYVRVAVVIFLASTLLPNFAIRTWGLLAWALVRRLVSQG